MSPQQEGPLTAKLQPGPMFIQWAARFQFFLSYKEDEEEPVSKEVRLVEMKAILQKLDLRSGS